MFDIKILAKSCNIITDDIIATFELTYPTLIHNELQLLKQFKNITVKDNTDYILNFLNSFSSPNFKDNVFIPDWKNAEDNNQLNIIKDVTNIVTLNNEWLYLCKKTVDTCKDMIKGFRRIDDNNDVEYVDKVDLFTIKALLAPFTYTTVIVTSTEWPEFFESTCPKNVVNNDNNIINYNSKTNIHIQYLAKLMYDLYYSKLVYELIKDWHIPCTLDFSYFADELDFSNLYKLPNFNEYIKHCAKVITEDEIDNYLIISDNITFTGISNNYKGFVSLEEYLNNKSIIVNDRDV